MLNKKKGAKRGQGPQTNLAKATYQLNLRRTRVWIPFLEQKVEELRTRVREKGLPAGDE